MESNLLKATKRRVLRELTDTIEHNPVYRDTLKVYHKFPFKERPMRGVILKNASASRIKLSSDDYAADLKSHVAVARTENKEGLFLDWVWEDEQNVTGFIENEDLSSQITGSQSVGTNRVFQVANYPIVSGYFNTKIADNFRQVDMFLDGERVFPADVDGAKGLIYLPVSPGAGQTLTISYNYKKISDPGRYYIELISETQYVIDPLYFVKGEVVIQTTTGVETSANLAHGGIIANLETLYTKRYNRSLNIELVSGSDYTVDTVTGEVTFLKSLPVGVTLYANYRWVGSTRGPFTIPDDFHYDNTSITGVILAFGNQKIVNDKVVIIVYPEREMASRVYSGHWQMSFDIDVFTRDTIELPDLTDFIIDDMWSRKRLSLVSEGLTIEEMDPVGESEEVYDSNTNDLYYKSSINLRMMTEWKRFVPYLTEIVDFDSKLYAYRQSSRYFNLAGGKDLDINIYPYDKEFVVKYPEAGYPKYV
jgi:hypothetical protein